MWTQGPILINSTYFSAPLNLFLLPFLNHKNIKNDFIKCLIEIKTSWISHVPLNPEVHDLNWKGSDFIKGLSSSLLILLCFGLFFFFFDITLLNNPFLVEGKEVLHTTTKFVFRFHTTSKFREVV